jgi:hypothetical protein
MSDYQAISTDAAVSLMPILYLAQTKAQTTPKKTAAIQARKKMRSL